jgi:hypothetical protein
VSRRVESLLGPFVVGDERRRADLAISEDCLDACRHSVRVVWHGVGDGEDYVVHHIVCPVGEAARLLEVRTRGVADAFRDVAEGGSLRLGGAACVLRSSELAREVSHLRLERRNF